MSAIPAPRHDRRRRQLVLGGLAVALAGCAPRGQDAGGRTVLVFKHGKLFGDPAALRGLLDTFERLNPRFEVREETLPSSSDDQHQFYAINLQSRSRDFDVFAVDVIWVAGFAQAGWLHDVSTLLPASERRSFFGGALQSVVLGERAYAIPWFVDAGLLYYRRDLLGEQGFAAPQLWSDLVDIARAVMPREPRLEGFVWQGKQYEGLVCNALEFLRSNGGDVLDGERVVLDTESNRGALGFMADLVDRLYVTPASVTTATEEPTRQLFGQGRAVFMRNWPYAWRLFQDEASRVHGKVGVAALPHFAGGMSAPTLGGWQLAVNAHSRHPEPAAMLVRFLTSAAAQKRLALAYGFQPSRVALYGDPDLLARQPFLGMLESVFLSARPRPVTPHYVRVSQILQSAFSAAIARRSTPAAALAAGQRDLERLLADEGRARA